LYNKKENSSPEQVKEVLSNIDIQGSQEKVWWVGTGMERGKGVPGGGAQSVGLITYGG